MAQGISFGHFNIVGGSVHEDGPYVAVVEDRTPAESVADLYLTLEPAGVADAALCADLLSIIVDQFGRPQYSLTGNLLQALRAAQEHLRARNRGTPPDRQAAAGATCLAVAEDQAYLAQAGPGLAYLRHDGRLRRFEAIEPDALAPLGTKIACTPEFSHFELNQGDTVLLISSRFAALVDDETVDLLLSLPPGEALPEIFKLVRHEIEFSALYLAVTGSLGRPKAEGNAEARPTGRPHPSARMVYPDSGIELASAEPPRRAVTAEVREPTEGAVPPPRPRRSDWLSKRRDLERLTEHRSLTVPRPALYTIAVVLVLTLAGWLGVPHLLKTGRQNRFDYLVGDVTQSEASASNAPGVAQKRALLERAQADIVEARTIRPTDPQLPALDARLTSELRALDQVRQLASTQTVADLSNSTITARSVNEIVAAGRVYVLDSSTGKVFAFDPHANGTPQNPVFQAGMDVESIRTGAAVHIAATPAAAGQPGLVYILDNNRRLFALDPSGTLRTIGIANANAWKSATAIADDGNSLYVLDSAGNQIWKFDASNGGFTAPPTALLSKADLSDAAQLSVAGQVYLGTSDGQLETVRSGRLESVTISGLDRPLRAPQPPVMDPSTSTLLIADPANQRIVVTDGSQTYQYQYAGAALQGLRVLAVDPMNSVLYALCGESIISAPLH